MVSNIDCPGRRFSQVMNSSSNAMQRKYFYAGHDHFLPVAIHPTAVTLSLYIQLLTLYIPVLSVRTNCISINNSVSCRYIVLIFHIRCTVISDSLLLLLISCCFHIIPVSSNSRLGMWGMLVLTFITKVPTVAYRGGGGLGVQIPPPKFRRPSKIVPNSTQLWTLLILLNLGRQHPKIFGKKAVKF